ncbi:MAG: thermonuclease family protein [Mariprofundus sp.]|nr:thermonuclease family protein [Mariprofundus sp.]
MAQAGGGTFSVIGQARWVQVASVFDGDTFRTRRGEKVRLLGINTPETAHGSQAAQAYGVEAKRRLRQLIVGQSVQLRSDKDKRDKYGRTLAQVYLRDGRWVNDIMVKEGLAHVYTFAPNFYWADHLLKSEAMARRDMQGMWKSTRWRILDAADISNRHIGQFHLVRGYVGALQTWRFKLGELSITVPRKSRLWFTPADLPKAGSRVLIGGVIRISSTGNRYLSLHSPYDLR